MSGVGTFDVHGVGRYLATPDSLSDADAASLLLDIKGRAITRMAREDGLMLDMFKDAQAGGVNDVIQAILGYDGSNYRRIKTDATGRLIVTISEGSGDEKSVAASVAGSATLALVVSDTLTQNVKQCLTNVIVSAQQYSEYQVEMVDDTTTTVLAYLTIPQGGGTAQAKFQNGEVAFTPTTAAPTIQVRGMVLGQPAGKEKPMRATICTSTVV